MGLEKNWQIWRDVAFGVGGGPEVRETGGVSPTSGGKIEKAYRLLRKIGPKTRQTCNQVVSPTSGGNKPIIPES